MTRHFSFPRVIIVLVIPVILLILLFFFIFQKPTDQQTKESKRCRCENAIDQPVCDTDGITHPNPCVASCIGATIDHEGSCGENTQWGM